MAKTAARLPTMVLIDESHSAIRSYLFSPTDVIMSAVPVAKRLTTEASRRRVSEDLAAKAAEIRARYGPVIGWDQLQSVLQDRRLTPFPCEIRFDSTPLLAGEFAHAAPKGISPDDGFIIYLHPRYEDQLADVPYLVLHQLVLISYNSATADDAETFGSLALGLTKEAYYKALCDLSGQIGGDELL